MVRRRGGSSPNWRSFLRNQAAGIAAIDMFIVASASFRLLYVMVILGHERRKIMRTAVTEDPTAAWLSRQLTEAHIVIFNERHLRRVLSSYIDYYHRTRTHLSLDEDCPDSRPVMPRRIGNVVAIPQVGGLHHRYQRLAA
jgi:hypothetical protein